MPYAKPKDVPAAVKKLSSHKRRVWRAAFNSSYANYKGDEKKAFATAWAAANKISDAGEGDEDDITLTMPLLIRLMEFSREDAASDLDLHKVAENVAEISLHKGCLEIDDYPQLVGEKLMPKDSISNRAQRWRSFREMIDAMNRKKIKDDDEGKTDTDEPEEVSEGQLKKKKGRKVNFAYGNDE